MSRRRSQFLLRGLFIVCCLAVCSLARVGHAEEKNNVDLFNERYLSGTQAYEKQDYELAIKHFQLAYATKPEPLLLYNIAQCHRKLGHDAEAITYYQSYLNSTEATDRELRAKAGRYLIDLRDRHASPAQSKLIYVETARERRPLWRIGLGAGLLAASAVLLGFGGRALYVDGRCVDAPSGTQTKCDTVVNSTGIGVGLVVAGAVVAVGGIVTIALPGRKYQVERPAEPTQETQPGGIKPVAAIAPTLQFVPESMGLHAGGSF